MRKESFYIIFLLLFGLSCTEATPKNEITDTASLKDTLITVKEDTIWEWYETYCDKFDSVSYESINNPFLKVALEQYFTIENLDTHSAYLCNKADKKLNTCAHTEDYTIVFKIKPFDSTRHIITKHNNIAFLIDNQVFWGTDLTMPIEEIETFTVTYKGVPIDIPEESYKDLYNPEGISHGPFIRHLSNGRGSYIAIIMYSSDAAGSYTVAWIFKEGKYIRRVVDSFC